jgi:ankyrin repeat protein
VRPLHLAIMRGSIAMVRLLVETGGADINAPRRNYVTPLDDACECD